MNWNDYFGLLADWKKLPAYKAEPRIDSLVGFFLPFFIKDYLNINVIGIIPELPIRLATVKPKHEGTKYADRSYKVDFLIIGRNSKNYLVEFKSDSGSRSYSQDTYLEEAKSKGTRLIVEGILKIAKASNYKQKYNHLISKLSTYGLIENGEYSGLNPTFEVVYVQPSNPQKENLIIDFLWISNWLNEKYPSDEFETEFAKTLKLWAED